MLLVEWFDAHKGDRTRRGCGVPGRLAVIKAGLEEAGWSGPTRPWRNDEVTLGTHYPRPSSHISAPIARAGPRLRRSLPTLSMEDQHEPRSPGDAVCWHGYRVRQRNLALNPP